MAVVGGVKGATLFCQYNANIVAIVRLSPRPTNMSLTATRSTELGRAQSFLVQMFARTPQTVIFLSQELGYLLKLTVICGCISSSHVALIYTMDELDPYRDMPASSKDESLLLPALGAMEYTTERSGMNGGLREQHADTPPARRDNGVRHWQEGHTMTGQREGGPLSAQASYLAICVLPADSYVGLF